MALLIALEKERGERVETVSDIKNVFQSALTRNKQEFYELLKYVDLYGNTVFNNLQMKILLKDLNFLLENAKDNEEKEIIKAIIVLCDKCLKEVHLYIKFYGD